MQRWIPLFLIALMASGVVGWKYRDMIRARISPPASAEHPAESPDVLYRWVDKEGVTHYSQQSGRNSSRVEYDGSRITTLMPMDAGVSDRAHAEALKAGEEHRKQKAREEGRMEESSPGEGSSLHELRRELQRGAEQMQAAKAARHPDI